MNSHIVCVFELSRYSSYVHDNTFIFPVVMFKGIAAVYYNDETLGPRPAAVNCCTHLLMGKYGVFLLADQGIAFLETGYINKAVFVWFSV